MFAGLGLVQPEQQVEIRDDLGRFVARVDFLFRELNLIDEFDGALKYAGAYGREALIAEIDKNVVIPPGTEIGYNAEKDRGALLREQRQGSS